MFQMIMLTTQLIVIKEKDQESSCSGSSWVTSNAVSLVKVQGASTSFPPGDIFKNGNLKLFSAGGIFLMQICLKYFLTEIFSSISFCGGGVMSSTFGPLSDNFFHGSLRFRFSPFREQEKKAGAYIAGWRVCLTFPSLYLAHFLFWTPDCPVSCPPLISLLLICVSWGFHVWKYEVGYYPWGDKSLV